jgi:hypothetical protein
VSVRTSGTSSLQENLQKSAQPAQPVISAQPAKVSLPCNSRRLGEHASSRNGRVGVEAAACKQI